MRKILRTSQSNFGALPSASSPRKVEEAFAFNREEWAVSSASKFQKKLRLSHPMSQDPILSQPT